VKQGDADVAVGRARPVDLTGGETGTDEALVRAAKSGEASAFGELYQRYRDPIYRYCLSRTGTAHDAEDLTSDVFVKALHSIDRYQERGLPFVAFLYRIARNAAIVAGNTGLGSRQALETAAEDADPTVAATARRALARREEVRSFESTRAGSTVSSRA